MKLSEVGLTLQTLDIGASDAESDVRLADYFVTTPQVRSALEFRRTHFLGRKGSGKSSLFSQLPRLVSDVHPQTKVIQITPDQYAWGTLRQYRELGLLPEQAHANAWKFTIALEGASALLNVNGDDLRQDARNALSTLKRFVRTNYGDQDVSLYATASRLLNGLESFNLEAFGFGVGLSRTKEQPVTPQVIDAILDALKEVAFEIGLVLTLDRLDDSWDGSEGAQSLLIGLLKAAKEINDKYSLKNGKGITVLIFLRSDIYESLRFDDKDKHRQIEEELAWNPELLKQMIQLRLPPNITVDELFEPGDMRGSIQPFNYLVKRTFLRPREVIQFIQECQRRSPAGAVEISKTALREAEERYSLWKVEDLKQEYRRRYPEFEDALEALRQGFHRYDSLDEFETYLRERIPALVDKFGARRLMELLFNASVIGIRLGNAGTARFKCEDSDLLLPASGGVYVHQSLYRGLSIRERRSGERGSGATENDPPETEWS